MVRQLFLVVLTLVSVALGQSADTRALASYSAAISAPPGERSGKLKAFLDAEPQSSLRNDALEWLTWTQLEIGDLPAAHGYAKRLLANDPENILALAAALNRAHDTDKRVLREVVEKAAGALRRLDQLHRPEGMAAASFANMRRQVAGLLDGAAGEASWRLGDYESARLYLNYALQVFPANAGYMYALGVVNLDGKPRNESEGYWRLARAVNLSHSGNIAQYAFRRYQEDGGTADQWRQFLAATAPANARYTTPQAETRIASASTPAARELSVPPLPPAPAETPEDNGPLLIPPEQRAARPGEPISLGILIETSLAGKSDRAALINSLTDMLRRLGRNDEAFILSFSHELVFEQDLTGNPEALEKALQAMQPQSGAALLEAVGFASGHLQRIARNPNRALLVISDGQNSRAGTMTSFQAQGQIDASNVRIYCIGLGVNDAEARARLEALATRTGGLSTFVPAARDFRAAAHQVAQTLGLAFPM